MAKDYSWFKFKLPDWMMGRIQKQKPEVRGVFLNLACKYWQKQCVLSIEDAKEELEEVDYAYDSLLKKQIIKEQDGNVVISFLDEQWAENQLMSEKKSAGGKASASKRLPVKNTSTGVEHLSTPVQQNSTGVEQVLTGVQDVLTGVEFCSTIKNEIREDKIREEENKNDNTPNGVVGLPAATPTNEGTFSDRCKRFIEKFNELRSTKFTVTDKVKKSLRSRLNKYSANQIIEALKTAQSDKHHIENNFRYLTPEYILREEILERYLNATITNNTKKPIGNVHQTALPAAKTGFRVQSGK